MEGVIVVLFINFFLWLMIHGYRRGRPIHLYPPSPPKPTYDASWVIEKWKLLKDEQPPIDVEVQFDPGPTVHSKDALCWYLLNSERGKEQLIDQLTERCAPDDLIALAMTNPEQVQFTNKQRLFFGLKELEEQGEWRQLGLLPSLVHSCSSAKAESMLSYVDIIVLNRAINEVLVDTASGVLRNIDTLYCAHHMRRCIEGERNGIVIPICPMCKKIQHTKMLDRIVAVLDQRSSWKVMNRGADFRVNALRMNDFFDFDAIEIGACTLDDINAFCIAAGNDPYLNARKKKRSYRLLPGIELSEQAIRNLEKVFEAQR